MSLITIYVPTSIHLQVLNNVLQPGLSHDFHSQPSTFKNQFRKYTWKLSISLVNIRQNCFVCSEGRNAYLNLGLLSFWLKLFPLYQNNPRIKKLGPTISISIPFKQFNTRYVWYAYPPLAITVWVPMMTLLTLDMMANTAESLITVVSMLARARLMAKAWP